MSKHSPGPWMAEIDDVMQAASVRDTSNRGVCPVAGMTFDERKANAALIAAAPEMLAALRRLFKACGHMPIEATPESAEMMMAGLDAVRAVIKATGEEP